MYYYVYKILNQINGKIYIGVHAHRSLKNSYMGSGKLLKKAIRKYGIGKFSKEILHVCSSREEMFSMEKEIVTEVFINRQDTYNLRLGGNGGSWKGNPYSQKAVKVNKAQGTGCCYDKKNQPAYRRKIYEIQKELGIAVFDPEVRKKAVIAAASPGAKEKRRKSLAKIRHQQGVRNSCYGYFWVTNGTDNIKLPKDSTVPTGFLIGRTIQTKYRFITDGVIDLRIPVGEIPPEGFKFGRTLVTKGSRGKKWVTNGISNLQLNRNARIPTGFWRGSTIKRK